MSEPYARIAELEEELAAARDRVAKLRPRPTDHGCGNPDHADLATKIQTQETLLRRMSRGRRTTARLEEGRGGRLEREIQRVEDEIVKMEPAAEGGDRVLLGRLRAAQQQRRLLELRVKAPETALVTQRSSFPLELRGSRRESSASTFGAIAAVLTFAGLLFTVTPVLLGLIATTLGAGSLAMAAFPSVRRDLVSSDGIYGERWDHVTSIAFPREGRLEIQTRKRRHRFSDTRPGYHDVVRIALAAAAANNIEITGTPPRLLEPADQGDPAAGG